MNRLLRSYGAYLFDCEQMACAFYGMASHELALYRAHCMN